MDQIFAGPVLGRVGALLERSEELRRLRIVASIVAAIAFGKRAVGVERAGLNTREGDGVGAAGGGDGDLFASADGISGQIIMKNSQMVNVTVDNEQISTPAYVDASGSFKGQNVPVDVVRSFATLIGILPSTFFGA